MRHLQHLLDVTSRTFALAIPLLPEPARTDVTLAYLLFRIADTLEDAENLHASVRIAALAEFDELLDGRTASRALAFAKKWTAKKPTDNTAYLELLNASPLVLEQFAGRKASIRRCVHTHIRQTISGMAIFLEQSSTHLASLNQLREYCYYVAGTVGEMLTEVFAERIDCLTPTRQVQGYARAFGEGLQLVNILKDSDDDTRCGRLFIPEEVQRSSLYQLARHDLGEARRYVDHLASAHAPLGYIAFTQLPLELAHATLELVERDGPGSKVPREEVARLLQRYRSLAFSAAG